MTLSGQGNKLRSLIKLVKYEKVSKSRGECHSCSWMLFLTGRVLPTPTRWDTAGQSLRRSLVCRSDKDASQQENDPASYRITKTRMTAVKSHHEAQMNAAQLVSHVLWVYECKLPDASESWSVGNNDPVLFWFTNSNERKRFLKETYDLLELLRFPNKIPIWN